MLDQLLAELSRPKNQVAIAKIIIDKGVLALVLAMFSLVAATLIERLKSSLSKQQEVLKITGPMVLQLLDRCDDLYEAGIAALRVKAKEFSVFEQWADNLTSANGRIEGMALVDIPHGAAARNAVLLHNGVEIALVDHLKEHTSNKRILDLIDTDAFWNQDAVAGPEGSLISHLFMLYMYHAGADRELMVECVKFQVARVFADCKLGASREYSSALFAFRQELLKSLYPGNSNQLRAISGIYAALERNRSAVEEFPKLDVGANRILNSSTAITAFDILAEDHAHIVRFVATYLRSH